MSKSFPARLLAAAVCAPLAAHAAVVGGSIVDAATGSAPPAGTFVAVSLLQCSHDGNALCDLPVDFVQSRDGSYRFRDTLAPGHYQVSVTADGYQLAAPAPFTVVAQENHRVDVSLAALPVAYSNPVGCAAPDARGLCHVAFDLRNTSGAEQDLDAWVVVATTGPVPAGWSRFAAGDRSAAPRRVRLAAGETRTVKEAVYVGRDEPKGALATLELYVSPHGAPDHTLVYDFLPTVYFGVPAGTAAERPARPAAKPAAGQRTTVTFRVTDAQTGQPLPLSAKPMSRLMACNENDDTYCRWIEGDAVPLPESGVAVVDVTGLFPGRYQFQTYAGDNYAYTYSATFDVPLVSSRVVAQPMARMPVAIDGATTCDAVPVDQCVLRYTLRNTTDREQRAALWLYDNMLSGEFSVGSSVFGQGRGGVPGAAPITVTLLPGETRTVAQPAGLGALASGSSGWLQLYVGDRADPAYGEGFYRLGNYTIWQDAGGAKMISVVPFPF